jgi:hypothetical protein
MTLNLETYITIKVCSRDYIGSGGFVLGSKQLCYFSSFFEKIELAAKVIKNYSKMKILLVHS